MDPPDAFTPFTVGKSRLVLNSQTILPVAESKARIPPSLAPENTTPSIAVTAADCAPWQFGPSGPHAGGGGGVYQARAPVARFTAWKPPDASGPLEASDTAK